MWSILSRKIQHAAVIPTAFSFFLSTSASTVCGAQPLFARVSPADTDAQAQCDRLAGPVPLVDPSTQGAGVDFDKIDVAAALPACQQAARSGSNPHYVALYAEVLRAAQRYPEAVKQSKKAADGGNPLAMINLAESYRLGQGVPRSPVDATAWYRKAADAGNGFAMSLLAGSYLDGNGVPQNDTEAAAWFRKSADSGNPPAMQNLGYLYEYGRGVPQSYAEAATWYRKAADTGVAPAFADAMANLGYLYEYGRGVPQSYAEAATWYRKSAENGNPNAMTHLGVLYQTGRGVPKSFTDAATWYQRAANQNYDLAKFYLGFLYQYGWGVRKDPNMALALFTQAANSKRPEVAAPAAKLAALLRNATASSDTESEDTWKWFIAGLLVLAAVGAANQNNTGTGSTYPSAQPQQDNSLCAAKAFGAFDGDGYFSGVFRGAALAKGCWP